ncbi:MAG: NAD(P)H-quinone dehydrogenase [Actinomycetes bacterium]
MVIIGGGPGGYEAALVAAQLGAEVTLVDRDGIGGSAVLTDCVPSKALITTAEAVSAVGGAGGLGVRTGGLGERTGGLGERTGGGSSGGARVDLAAVNARVDLAAVNARVLRLATAQSLDITGHLQRAGVRLLAGVGRLEGPTRVVVRPLTGDLGPDPHADTDRPGAADRPGAEVLDADVVLLATGARPRVLSGTPPDGQRVLSWEQVYALPELPEHLVVVGSGVTGAEFASAYTAMGVEVTLVSSRDRVLPGEDPDAAAVIEDVFARRGMRVLGRSRAEAVQRVGDEVRVHLTDGSTVVGSHVLLAVGSQPNTSGLGLSEAGVCRDARGFIEVDRVSRTSARGVYAAGDVTGILMLASVAAMQGRIAMWHALGDAVTPLDLGTVASTVFTDPEIATVGVTQDQVDTGRTEAVSVNLPLATNARAKMSGIDHGFVKLFARPGTGVVVGGVVVAPHASELIFPVSLAVTARLTVDQVAQAFSVYPSLSGSVAEAARRLHRTS